MFYKQKRNFSRTLIMARLFILAVIFAFAGCASAPKTIDPAVNSPQVIVNPEAITLGIANLIATKIVFEGTGFEPNDDVFISLTGVEDINAPVACAKVNSNGKFTAPVDDATKITAILRATVTSKYAKDGKQIVIPVITQPPIPVGTYTAKVTSMLSNKTAETKLMVKEASIGDSLKDWLGKRLGKIQDKRP